MKPHCRRHKTFLHGPCRIWTANCRCHADTTQCVSTTLLYHPGLYCHLHTGSLYLSLRPNCWAVNKVDTQRIDAVEMVPTKNLGHSLARLSEMPTSVALPTSHHFHPSLSPIVLLSLGILREWMKMQNCRRWPSNLRTPSRELEATTGAAAHNLDEEHSWRPVFAVFWDTWR